MTTLSTYLAIARDLPKQQAIAQRAPAVATATKYFQANIGAVKSADDLLKNPRLFNYAMSAFGLGDRTSAAGLMRQVLRQGTTSSKALATTLHDPNILAFAKAFDFAGKGATTTASASFTQSIVSQYVENALETDQTTQNPGVGLALYFQRKAPSITTALGLLADRKLLNVVQTALGISPLTALEPIDPQAALLSKKINFADFQNPQKLQNFISRFSAMYDFNGGASGASATSTNAILVGAAQDVGGGLDQGLLQTLQAYRSV